MEQTIFIIEAEQQRSCDLAPFDQAFAVTKAADNAICTAISFYLLHPVAVSKLIRQIPPFGDDAVAAASCRFEPPPRVGHFCACRRQAEARPPKVPGGEIFKDTAPRVELCRGKVASGSPQQVEGD